MSSRMASMLAAVTLLTLTACGGEKSEAEMEAERQAARADSVAMAEALYDASAFDTITWESEGARLERGGMVWRASCEKCHGPQAGGNGEAALRFQIEVPSFRVPGWPYDGDIEALRHRIFVGYSGAMPNWGLHDLKYRDIDAVAAYIDATIGPVQATQQ
jgi:mono/diheme cytochrome c family protein